jgi:hypothetical protein
MAFFGYVTNALENNEFFSKRINFGDQSINRRLALAGSIHRETCTMDLKDASDRIAVQLARRITRNSPGIQYFLKNFRSNRYVIRNRALNHVKHGEMHAIAGMGSGLTFPFLGFITHLSVCSLVSMTFRIPYKQVAEQVYVYGDDLIVPSQWFTTAQEALEKSCLRVNVDKSFVKGPFRESCGGDYLNGKSVAPTRLKLSSSHNEVSWLPGGNHLYLAPAGKHHHDAFLVGLIKNANELKSEGRLETAAYLFRVLRDIGYAIPLVGVGSPILGELTDDTNAILRQTDPGSVSTVPKLKGKLMAYVPVEYVADKACPYKLMAPTLKKGYEPVVDLVKSLIGKSSGNLPIPRRSKIVKRVFCVADAMPVPEKDCQLKLESRLYHYDLRRGETLETAGLDNSMKLLASLVVWSNGLLVA